MALIYKILSFVFISHMTYAATSQLAQTECPGMVQAFNPTLFNTNHIIDLDSKCRGATHVKLTQAEQDSYCSQYDSVMADYQRSFDDCAAALTSKQECVATGGIWESFGGIPWAGMCGENCPGGTSLAMHPQSNKKVCSCPAGGAIPVNSLSMEACDTTINEAGCGTAPTAFSNADEIDIYNQCTQVKRQAEDAARVQAQNELGTMLQQHQTQCESRLGTFQSSCSNVKFNNSGISFDAASTVSMCENLEQQANDLNEQNTSQIETCNNQGQEILSFCGEAREMTVTKSAAAGGRTFGDITAEPTNSQLAFLSAALSAANSVISSLGTESERAQVGLGQLQREAQACVANLSPEQNDPPEDIIADDSGVAPTTDSTLSKFNNPDANGSDAEKTQSNSGELAQGISGLASSISPGGGGSGSSANTSYGTSYKAYSDSGSTLGDFGGGASGGGNSYSAGSGYQQNNTSFGKNSDPYIKTQDAPSKIPGAANAQAGAGSPGGFGGNSGAGGGAGLPPASANARSANGRSGRRSAMAKARNLIGGFKRKKQEAGSGLKKRRNLSPQQMKFAFEKASKKFGKRVPLKFDGTKYVPDLKAMKNSRSFRARNARAVAMYEGSKAVEQTLDEKMREKGINPNAGHGMFKTMNIYFRRKFDKASQANGLNI